MIIEICAITLSSSVGWGDCCWNVREPLKIATYSATLCTLQRHDPKDHQKSIKRSKEINKFLFSLLVGQQPPPTPNQFYATFVCYVRNIPQRFAASRSSCLSCTDWEAITAKTSVNRQEFSRITIIIVFTLMWLVLRYKFFISLNYLALIFHTCNCRWFFEVIKSTNRYHSLKSFWVFPVESDGVILQVVKCTYNHNNNWIIQLLLLVTNYNYRQFLLTQRIGFLFTRN